MITVKNKDELDKLLEEGLCIDTADTQFDIWLKDTRNMTCFVSELNSEWENLTDCYKAHLEMTNYQNSDDVWENYFGIIHSLLQRIVDRTDFNGDMLECV